jgi:protein involved in sex pheromone biosynthesis
MYTCQSHYCTENEASFSKLKVKGVRIAREVIKRLSYLSDIGLITAITKGQITNVSITPNKDIARATTIYGKAVASLKGKTVNRGNTYAPFFYEQINQVFVI